ncbi:MAG: hypothetical protein ACFE7R_06950 [Candidatus Hodarchaeota archaeon]
MSEDVNERLKEKTLQIAHLQQQMEALQAQLQGSHRRASQFSETIANLEHALTKKDSEIESLKADLGRTRGAFDAVAKQMHDIRSEQTQQMAQARPTSDIAPFKENLAEAEKQIAVLKDSLRKLSQAAISVLNEEPSAIDVLHDTVMEVGDLKFKILNTVLEKRSARMDELASIFLIDTAVVSAIVDELQAAGEVELREGHTIVPAEKYRATRIPIEEWQSWNPPDILDSLEEIVGGTEGHEGIAKAIQAAVDILEQKLARGGALVFQMRKTAGTWERTQGNVEELQYTIREWKGRVLSLM